MKQKSRIASKLFAVLVVLTLISCCFLGTTFARYTSGQSGAASVNVAKWGVTIDVEGTEQSGSTILSFGELSPNDDNSNQGSNQTAKIKVAELKNEGSQVDVTLTLSLGDIELTGNTSNLQESSSTPQYPTKKQVEDLFSIKVYYSTSTDSAEAATTEVPFATDSGNWTSTFANNTTYYIYAQVTWTTDSTNVSETNGWYGDKLDTYVGQNIETVQWDLSYTAVQASEQPTA